MVKRVPKSTTSVKKADPASSKKTVIKEKKPVKLTNGSVKENPEVKSDTVNTKSDEEIVDNIESERLSDMETGENKGTASEITQTSKEESVENEDTAVAKEQSSKDKSVENMNTDAQSNKDTEMKELHQDDLSAPEAKPSSSSKSAPKSLKRKAASSVEEKKTTVKRRTKKQKVFLEIPEISSVIGKVFVVGDNSVGQLGLDTDETDEKKRPTLLEMPYPIVDIAAGGMHSVCLTQTGEVITFGCNDEGALGRESEDGTEYIPKKVDIPEKIVQVSAGDSHTAALSESGQVYIWGNFRNNNGSMGLIKPTWKQPLPEKILEGVTIVKITSGDNHLSCLSDEGILYTCGNGETGQLGRISEHSSANGGRQGMSLLISPQAVPVRLSAGKAHITDVWNGSFATFLKSNNGAIYACGLNNYGQLGVNPDQTSIFKPKKIDSFNDRNWTQIDGGQHHTLALDNKGLVYSLGRSEYGRLGLGEDFQDAISEPSSIPSLQDKKCINVSCGNVQSYSVEDNGSVYSWGMGTNHALGHGNENDQHIPKLVEGNFYNSWKALKVSGGGNHVLILACTKNTSEETN